jgi:hypothetical protein
VPFWSEFYILLLNHLLLEFYIVDKTPGTARPLLLANCTCIVAVPFWSEFYILLLNHLLHSVAQSSL